MTNDIVTKLNTFYKKRKFSSKDWIEAGMNPIKSTEIDKFENLFNKGLLELIDNISVKNPLVIISNILKDFDDEPTEEKEIICEKFLELGQILNLNIKFELNEFMYGTEQATLIKDNKTEIIESKEFNCDKCLSKLGYDVTEQRIDIPNFYMIIECTNCKNKMLIQSDPFIERISFHGSLLIDSFSSDEFTYSEVEMKFKLCHNRLNN